MLHRKVNIFFSLALVFVFILFADAQDHKQILAGILFAFLLSGGAFLFNWLTIDGAMAASIFGSVAYGVGGWVGAAVVLTFFISSSLFSKNLTMMEGFSEERFRRDGNQVWSNGFWFALFVLTWFLSGVDAFMMAAVTAVATSTADTWATEIGGNRLQAKTWLITNGKKVKPGSDGGISVPGTLSALAGAIVIAGIYWAFNLEMHFGYVLVIAVAGFSGSLIDSYFGARFQHGQQLPPEIDFASFTKGQLALSNNAVNWLSSGIAAFLSLILTLIISL